MSVLYLIIAVLLLFWLIGWWLGRGEDLSGYDHPVEPSASERFSRPDGPSPEHRQAEEEIAGMSGQFEGVSQGEMLQLMRDFMEELPAGREFNCEFRPVDVGGVKAEWVLAPGCDPNRRVLYIHGGAFIAGSPRSHRTITSRYSATVNAAVLSIDYRLMPENRRQDGIDDCCTAYCWILENGPDGSGAPERLYVSGDSAGGTHSLVLSAWVRDEGLRLPDGVIALSPLTDSTYSSPSIRGNVKTDTMLGPIFGKLMKVPGPLLNWLFLKENRIRPSDPRVSPLRGDLAGLAPTLIQCSGAEMLLDDARRYVNRARAAGSPARIQVWDGLLHVWQMFNPEVPEAMEAFEQIGRFVRLVEKN